MIYLFPFIHLLILQIKQLYDDHIKDFKKLFFLFIHNLLHIYIIYGGIISNTLIHLIICVLILFSWIIFDKCIFNKLHNINKNKQENEIYKDTLYYLNINDHKYIYLLMTIIILIDCYILFFK